MPRHTPFRDWVRPFAVSMALAALVAAGLADRGIGFPLVVLATAALTFGLLFRAFPGNVDFAFGTATGFAVYACSFTLISRSAVPAAPGMAVACAFLLPMLCLIGAVQWHGEEVLAAARDEEAFAGEHVWRTGRWMGLLGLLGGITLSLPLNRWSEQAQGMALLALMALVGALVAWAVRDVVRFLVDVALLLHDLTRRISTLAVPVATFVTLYTLITVVFACAYRIADDLSLHPLFHGEDGAIRLSFGDALHFSVATISTVGYGDIRPRDDGVRLLAAVEVLAGQILLLFGFYEIMNSRRVNRALERAGTPAPDEDAADPPGPAEAGAGKAPAERDGG